MKPKIVVVGSSNTDMVIKTKHLPLPGETVLGGNFFMNAGGKGANQAVAAARLNAEVTFVTKVGEDLFGKTAKEGFEKEGINIDFVFSDNKNTSGIALITVDEEGENCIAVASGANAALNVDDVNKAEHAIEEAEVILVQLEIPLQTVEQAIKIAVEKNKKVILNPAPATTLPEYIYKDLFAITPNEKEASMLSGIEIKDIETLNRAAHFFIRKGVKQVIITLGENGLMWCDGSNYKIITSPHVKPEDTTGAGDIFNGALAVAFAENKEILESILFACYAATLSVTRLGAQSSAPNRHDVESFIRRFSQLQ